MVFHLGFASSLALSFPHQPVRRTVTCQAVPPTPPRRPNRVGAGGEGEAEGGDNSSKDTSGLDSRLRAPNDATPLRSESEVRRNAPAKRVPRRRRRGERSDSSGLEIEWDKAESVPLVTGQGARDGWVDLKAGARKAAKAQQGAERLERSRGKVDDAMKEKLKKEIVQPYTQNWIGVVVVAVALLAIAFWLSGGFETIPVIPVPDL